MLKGVPHGLLFFVPLIQRMALGLRLQMRPSPDHVLGWKVADRSDSWLRIEAASSFLTAHVVLLVDDGQLSLATSVRYDLLPAALVWPVVSLAHRPVALGLVTAERAINNSGRP